MVTKAEIKEALKKVIDPELGVNIVDLGLVYGIEIKKRVVKIKMTLTSVGCPLLPMIQKMIEDELMKLDGVDEVKLDLVWEPPWTPSMMSEEVRAELGMD